MKDCIFKAIKMINSNLIYVFLFSLSPIMYGKFELLFLIVGVIISVGVCGHFINLVKYGKDELTFLKNSEMHIFNFLIVNILTNVPILLNTIFTRNIESGIVNIYIDWVLRAVICTFTVYVLPIVFLKRINIQAIPIGIKFLLKKFKYSLPLLFLSYLWVIGSSAGVSAIFVNSIKHYFGNRMSLYILVLLRNYSFLVVFIAASITFLEFSNERDKKILEENG